MSKIGNEKKWRFSGKKELIYCWISRAGAMYSYIAKVISLVYMYSTYNTQIWLPSSPPRNPPGTCTVYTQEIQQENVVLSYDTVHMLLVDN